MIDKLADTPGSVLITTYASPEDTRQHAHRARAGGFEVVRVDLGTERRVTGRAAGKRAMRRLYDRRARPCSPAHARSPDWRERLHRAEASTISTAPRDRWALAAARDRRRARPGQFEPLAFDDSGDNLYALAPQEGRQALFKVALDGRARRTLVFAQPPGGYGRGRRDRPIRPRRRRRIYGTETRTARLFDPEFEAADAPTRPRITRRAAGQYPVRKSRRPAHDRSSPDRTAILADIICWIGRPAS